MMHLPSNLAEVPRDERIPNELAFPALGVEDERKRPYEGGSEAARDLDTAAKESWHFPFKSTAAKAHVAMRVGVMQVATGKAHTLFLTRRQEVWTCGRGGEGQLGHANFNTYKDPQFLRALHAVPVTHVWAGAWHSSAMDKAGNVYTWGDNRQGQLGHGDTTMRNAPDLVPRSRTCPMSQVALGNMHSMLLARDGSLYVCGSNRFGQLGTGDREDCAEPKKLQSVRSIAISKIATGHFHSCFLTHSGDLWSFGRGTEYQLGHGDLKSLDKPKPVEKLVCYWCTDVSAGEAHTVVLTDEQEVLTFGTGDFGQLGLGAARKVAKSPAQVGKLEGQRVVEVQAGSRHTMVRTEEGDTFSWGCGLHGRLGHGNQRHYWAPRRMHLVHQLSVERDHEDYPFPKLPVPEEDNAKDDEAEELAKMAAAITAIPFHLQREFTDTELVEFKRCFDQIDVDESGAVDQSEISRMLRNLGEDLAAIDVAQAIREVDANDNGTVEFDEFVQMVFNMRSGVSEVHLAMVYSTIPQGNELSTDAYRRLMTRVEAMSGSGMRLEARRVFWHLDLDHSGEIDVAELKTAMKLLGLRATSKQLREIIHDFDDDGNGVVELKEFLSHFDAFRDASQKRGGFDRFMQAVTTYWHKREDRVLPVMASRFARTFRKRCRKMGVVIKEQLDSKLSGMHEDTIVMSGVLDLRETRLRDTHVLALAYTVKAVPIFWNLKLTGNYITDAGAKALMNALEYQNHDANFGSGAGGASPILDEKRKTRGWAAPDETTGSDAVSVMSDPWKVSTTRTHSRGRSRRSHMTSDLSTTSPHAGLASLDELETDSKVSPSGGAEGAAGAGGAGAGSMVSHPSVHTFDASDVTPRRGVARHSSRRTVSTRSMGSTRSLDKHGSARGSSMRSMNRGSIRKASSLHLKRTYSTNHTPAHRQLIRSGVRPQDIICCDDCKETDVRTPVKPGGKEDKFVVFENVTQCRKCDHEWVEPVHYVTSMTILDPMKPERLLALAKVRLQNASRNRVHWILSHEPMTLEHMRLDHEDMVTRESLAFKQLLDRHGSHVDTRGILEAELVRYGISCFHTHEILYHRRIKQKVERLTIVIVNELSDQARVLYRALVLPREWPKFVDAMQAEQDKCKGELELRMHGWTVKTPVFHTGYKRLNALALKIMDHYQTILRHVSTVGIACGHNFSALWTVPGEAWTFGDTADGRVGHGKLADGQPQLAPRLVLMARPADDRELVGGIRLRVLDCAASHKCDAGGLAVNVEAGGYVVWNQVMVPPEATVLRCKVWSNQNGAMRFREDGLSGKILCQIVVTPTDDEWRILTAVVPRHTKQVLTALYCIFNCDNACQLEWVEFISPAPGT